MYTIGIDIGGTHTDGVLLNAQGKSLAYGKTTTTFPLHEGVKIMIAHLLKQTGAAPDSIKNVIMGTTHATNAILEGKNLLKVGLLRLMIGQPRFPSPGFNWPSLLKDNVIGAYETCEGGYECDGRSSSKFHLQEVKDAVERLLEKGCEAISVVGTFSPLNGQQEQEAARIIQELAGTEFPISLSHQIGGIGLIERENAALLNSALKKVILEGFVCMKQALEQMNIHAQLWLTENNGSLLSLDEAIHFPIKTIGAGPTNSFIGASKLCGIQEAIVVDMGGTSTDIGIVEGGYARSSLQAAAIGGISLHFSMPDMISLAIGGGSHVQFQGASFQVGPQSVARQLKNLSKVFGGPTLTLTDVGVAFGSLEIEGGNKENIGLSNWEAQAIIKKACQQIYQSILRLRGKKHDMPVILVGGGAALMKPLIQDFGLNGWMPAEAAVANAYGAGLAEISSVVDKVVSLKEREKVLNELKEQAKRQAIVKGADQNQIRIAGVTILPFAYTSDALAKVVITASGPRVCS
jgi:N-methylhydantoinase A/oxoprolinase/acetone carboxylase beta subunit